MSTETLSINESEDNSEVIERLKALYGQHAERVIGEVARAMNLKPAEDGDIIDGALSGVYLKLETYLNNGHELDEEHFTGLLARATKTYFLDQIKHRKTGVEGHLQRVEPAADDDGDTRTIEDIVADEDSVETIAGENDSAAQIAAFYASLTTTQTTIVKQLSDGKDEDTILRAVRRTDPDFTEADLATDRRTIEERARQFGLVPAEEELVA